ncbi:dihydrodipicolinate synthase family protein [Yinghuangia aomiensis]
MDLLSEPPEGFAVLAGDDVLLGPLLALGAAGGILASAHVATRAFADVVEAWQGGDVPQARALGSGLVRLSARLFAEPNPAVVKGVPAGRAARSGAPPCACRCWRRARAPVAAALEALGDVDSPRTALAAV